MLLELLAKRCVQCGLTLVFIRQRVFMTNIDEHSTMMSFNFYFVFMKINKKYFVFLQIFVCCELGPLVGNNILSRLF